MERNPVTEKFVDNFILRVLVADYITENNAHTEVCSINRTIGSLLDRYGLTKCKVKAIAFTNVKDIVCSEMLKRMPYRDEEKDLPTTKYYYQEYKIACTDLEYGTVLDFIRKRDYVNRAF